MIARHNEDFLKTHVPNKYFDKCLLHADGRDFTTVDSLVDYLGNNKLITQITSWNRSMEFDCSVSDVVEFSSKVKR